PRGSPEASRTAATSSCEPARHRQTRDPGAPAARSHTRGRSTRQRRRCRARSSHAVTARSWHAAKPSAPIVARYNRAISSMAAPRFLSDEMGRREVALTLGALMLCVFLAALDSSIVANALPRVIAELHGFELYAWVTTGYLLSSTAVTPIGGKLGDRYGRKPLLIGGAGFFLATTLLCGVAQSMPQLIALRTLQGVGGGVLT